MPDLNKMGKLILVPTPIGNLSDITDRAKEYIIQARIVLAEDTRTTRKLFNLLGIKAQLAAFHMHNEHSKVDRVVQEIQINDNDTVLVCDAGTPGISDPGFLIVRECIKAKVTVEALPGPTALIPALVSSGMPSDRFVFEGFLPLKKGRMSRIKEWLNEKRTIVFYESPHRLLRCLTEMQSILGESRDICIAREISKLHETYHRGTIREMLIYFTENEARGEIVIILSGKDEKI
jgi:16S rRNA (cytidine1402-2'-O)-methyltransferase